MEIKEIANVLETILPGSDFLESDIYFEPLSMSGLEEMHEYSIDERLYEFFEMDSFKSIDDTRNYINKQLTDRMSYNGEQKRGMCWFIRRIHDKKLICYLSNYQIFTQNREEIKTVLGNKYMKLPLCI